MEVIKGGTMDFSNDSVIQLRWWAGLSGPEIIGLPF